MSQRNPVTPWPNVNIHAAVVSVFLPLMITSILPAAEEQSSPPWPANQIVTTIMFNDNLLGDISVEIRELQTTASDVGQHQYSVTKQTAPAFMAIADDTLYFDAPQGQFEDFLAGMIKHQGGFTWAWPSGSESLQGFLIGPGPEVRTIEVMNVAGDVLFTGDHFHFELNIDANKLQVFNVDLRISANLATRMGRPETAGQAVGVLTLTGSVTIPDGAIVGGGCTADWVGDVDVLLNGLNSVSQQALSGGNVVMTPSATLKNVGDASVPWYGKFSGDFPPYINDQHPFLVWSVFRVSNGVMNQLGVSGVKHAFFTINTVCPCSGGNILYVDCEDTYGEGTNTSNNSLAWREEISPGAGLWAHCDEPVANTVSHFDQDGDCDQDFFGDGEDLFTHGLVVSEADLQTANAEYYFQAWYIVRDDINIFNTMGWRQINPVKVGSFWTFAFLTDLVNSSPVDAWVAPAARGVGEMNETLATAEGHIQLAVKTTDLGNGQYRYDYGLMNHDYDRKIKSFSLPIDAAVTVTNPGFSDIDTDAGNNWVATINADSIIWEAPTGADALDWGTMYNFSFQADIVPQMSQATLVPEDAGATTEEIIATLAAGGSHVIFSDDFETGNLNSWLLIVP